tara:strand:+ start:446 stop:694 length:249 start_codon:yes stop_codon:yes gene_type:complete
MIYELLKEGGRMKKIFLCGVIFILCSSCSEFALITSGSSLALSHNSYAKMYNGLDFLTVITTEKSIQKHTYEKVKLFYDQGR